MNNIDVNVKAVTTPPDVTVQYKTIILKKHLVNGVNTLTQEIMSAQNTKYVIKYDYVLDGNVIIPENCILEFDGGSIDNGIIVGNNTIMIYNKPIDEVCPAERQGTFIYNTTIVDEEDITSESGQLKFKDRPATDGMGRKILRKNIVDGVNTLTQSMMQATNTIYIIQYDFALGEDITVPANCVLKFDGGSINGTYTLTANNTGIDAELVKILGTDVTLTGSWNIAEAYPEWFGAVGDGVADDRLVIQKTIDSFVRTRLLRKTYFINSTNNGIGLSLGRGRIIQGTGMFSTTLDSDREQSCIKVDSNLNIESVIVIASLCELHNIGIEGNKVNENSACVSNSTTESRISLINVAVAGAHYGFKMTTYLSNIKQCIASSCDIGFHFTGRNVHNTSLTLETCFAVSCKTNGYYFEKITYSTIISCAADGCGSKDINAIDYAYKLFNCNNILFSACGCEECMKVIWGRDIDNISFINCNWYLNKYILELPNDYKLTDIVYLRDSHCVTIYGCQFNISALNDYIESNGRLINLYSSSDAWTILYFMCAAAGKLDYAHFGSSSGLNIDKVMKYTYPNAELTAGGFAGKPTFSTPSNRRGYMYFDTVKNKPYWQKGGNKWSDADGVEYDVKKSGTFAERPAISEVYIGYMYFCTSGASVDGGTTEKPNIPIYYIGNGNWVDVNGITVTAYSGA